MNALHFGWSRSAIRPVCIGGLLVSAGTLGVAMLASAPVAAWDDEAPMVGRMAPEPGPSSPIWRLDDFDRDARQRIRKLAEGVLAALTPNQDLDKHVRDLGVELQAKEFAYEKAKLAREVAEFGLKTYAEGTALQDLATAKDEIRLAENALAESKADVSGREAKLRETKAKKADDSNVAVQQELDSSVASLTIAQLTLQKKQLELEQAQGQLTVQNDYLIPKRTKELQAEVEKAKSNELVQLQTFRLARDELESLKRKAQLDRQPPASEWVPVLKGIEGSVELENELRAVLNQGAPAAVGESLKWFEKVVSQANRLRAVLGKAEQPRDDLELKPILRKLGAGIPPAKGSQTLKSEK